MSGASRRKACDVFRLMPFGWAPAGPDAGGKTMPSMGDRRAAAPVGCQQARLAQRLLAGFDVLVETRGVFWATAAGCVALMWSQTRLPMVDLPQHAAQVALLRDLVLGQSAWADLVEINLRSPYLVGYLLALPAALVMPAGAAITAVLSLVFVGFVAGCVALRREAKGDARLDWLAMPSFFGLAWKWGYFPFLVALPLLLWLLVLAMRHGREPALRRAVAIVVCGLALLASHGMAFLFAGAAGGAAVLASVRSHAGIVVLSRAGIVVRLAPFAVLGVALVGIALASRGFGTPFEDVRFIWGIEPAARVLSLVVFGHGFTGELAMLTVAALAVPFALGCRLQRGGVGVALLVVLVVWVLVLPKDMMGAVHWAERFGVMFLPFYVMLWQRADIDRKSSTGGLAALALVATCWGSLGLMGLRLAQFGHEARDFESVMAAAEPGKRAISIPLDPASQATRHPFHYLQHGMWYQADARGLVDYNFASLHNLIVRFRPGKTPPLDVDFAWDAGAFDWKANRGRDYELFFVRHGERQLPERLVANGECRLEIVAQAGAWSLLKRGQCNGGSRVPP
jgi:hypothetical protein